MTRKLSAYILVITCLCFAQPALAVDESVMPDQATLSANRMRFDAETGDFIADGNVSITAGELRLTAPEGSGNVDSRVVNFDKGITASGKWYGDKVNLKAGKVSLSFQDVPSCKFQNGVKGSMGTMKLDADRLTITGTGGIDKPSGNDTRTRFWINKARNIEDSARGLSFGADSVEGLLKAGDLHELTAKKDVWLKGKPKANGDPVSLKGDNALYSLERGSVVVSGHVTAVQGGRTLRSDSVVYFPDQNRVEALGGLTRKTETGEVNSDRAEITIDINRERKQQKVTTPPKPAKKEEPKPKSKKKSSSSSSSSKTRKTRKK
ncbi:MAG: hypothetical protein IJ697_01120 [Synergistaceae bacterium]|nr:hypothetical protein [Synergistaceae bacterium]